MILSFMMFVQLLKIQIEVKCMEFVLEKSKWLIHPETFPTISIISLCHDLRTENKQRTPVMYNIADEQITC